MGEHIRLKPGLSDQELEAERDAKHAREVQAWFEANEWARP